jgi:hypothetical protein
LEKSDIGAFAAEIALGAGIFFVAPDFGDSTPFRDDFESAVAVTKHARSFFPLAHDFLFWGDPGPSKHLALATHFFQRSKALRNNIFQRIYVKGFVKTGNAPDLFESRPMLFREAPA